MVICWKFSTRARRTFCIASEDAVTRRSFRRGDGIGCNFGRDSPANPIKKIQRLSFWTKPSVERSLDKLLINYATTFYGKTIRICLFRKDSLNIATPPKWRLAAKPNESV